MADEKTENKSVKTTLEMFQGNQDVAKFPKAMLRVKDPIPAKAKNAGVAVPKPVMRVSGVPKTIENAELKCDSKLFTSPMQLIYIDDEGKFRCDDKALAELNKIDHPLNVVAVTGLYRSGKSYLLNRLAGQSRGFHVGHTTNAETKGIWVWCRPHPTQEAQVLMLMDSEGTGDVSKINRMEDTWLFTLTALLSSTLVYNQKGGIDANAIEKWNFLHGIDSSIKIIGDGSDESLIDFFFPVFVVALRDFGLHTVSASGDPVTPDQHLEECLTVNTRLTGKDAETYNKTRLLTRKYFKERKCFTFETPCKSRLLSELATLSDEKLDEDFVEALQTFSAYIFSRQPKTLQSGRAINGRMFSNLALHYTNSIRDNKTTSLLEAARCMAETENQYAVNTASDIYKKEMQKRLAVINPNDSTLLFFHNDCMTIAIDFFKNAIVFDDQDLFHNQMVERFKTLFSTYKGVCDKNSEGTCRSILQRLDLKITIKMNNQAYRHPSGHEEYLTDMQNIVKQYRGTTGLGQRREAVLQEYIDGKEYQEKQVLQLVREADQESSDINLPSSQPYQGSRRLKDSIARPTSILEKLTEEDVALESQLKDEITKMQANGIEVIRQKCDYILQSKIKETERQMQERSGDKDAINVLEAEITRLNKLLEQARSKVNDDQQASSGKGNVNGDVLEGTVYNVPWDRFAMDFNNYCKPHNTLNEKSNEDQRQHQPEGKYKAKVEKRCIIQ